MSSIKNQIVGKNVDSMDLGFGRYFSPKASVRRYEGGAWGKGSLVDFESIHVHPAAGSVQYAQSIFEGLKAFRGTDGSLRIFRPDYHAERFALSADRLCMPAVSKADFLEDITAMVKANAETVPSGAGRSLYIRPTLYGTEVFLGVRPSETYDFLVLGSPVAEYYSSKNKKNRIWIEQQETRAAPGGIGFAKAGANYAASLHSAVMAKKQGFDQVLWLGGEDKRWIEEVGTMNVFFVFEDEIVTPPLRDTLLAGCTRDTIIQLIKSLNMPFSERDLSLDEIVKAADSGELREVFGSGTAVVLSPVGELHLGAEKRSLMIEGESKVADQLKRMIQDIQFGVVPDTHGWVQII